MRQAQAVTRTLRRRIAAFIAVTAITVVGSTSMTAQPAAAGISGCIGVWAYDGIAHVQHLARCGPNGTYHIHIWGGGHDNNSPDYSYIGNVKEFFAKWPVPEGTPVCAELWYHKPGGGYESMGLACDDA